LAQAACALLQANLPIVARLLSGSHPFVTSAAMARTQEVLSTPAPAPSKEVLSTAAPAPTKEVLSTVAPAPPGLGAPPGLEDLAAAADSKAAAPSDAGDRRCPTSGPVVRARRGRRGLILSTDPPAASTKATATALAAPNSGRARAAKPAAAAYRPGELLKRSADLLDDDTCARMKVMATAAPAPAVAGRRPLPRLLGSFEPPAAGAKGPHQSDTAAADAVNSAPGAGSRKAALGYPAPSPAASAAAATAIAAAAAGRPAVRSATSMLATHPLPVACR